jgi:uncharacterized membrane protein YcaP (DUF421 family)
MDPLRIVLRALFAYVVLLVLLRLAGKRTVHHASAFDFVLAIAIGDLVDNAIWAEVPLVEFCVAATTLLLAQIGVTRFSSLPDDASPSA